MVINVLVYFSTFFIGLVLGGALVFFFRRVIINRQMRIADRKATRAVAEARLEAKGMLNEAKQEAEKVRSQAETDFRERRSELQRQESRLSQKAETLEHKLEGMEQPCF